MAPLSRFFRASISAALLRNATLAIALLMPTSPVQAEVVSLFCQAESGGSFRLRVDYDQKTVTELRDDGTPGQTMAATITEGTVTWEVVKENVEVFKGRFGRFKTSGSLNRISGQGTVTYWRMDTEQGPYGMSGPCRRATQKF